MFYSNRSVAFLDTNQFEMARRDAVEAALLDPKWTKAYMRLARVRLAHSRVLCSAYAAV